MCSIYKPKEIYTSPTDTRILNLKKIMVRLKNTFWCFTDYDQWNTFAKELQPNDQKMK